MVLVIIGVLFLLDNIGTIDFDWFSLIRLWPILLVMAGVNLVFAHNRTGVATAIKMLVLLGGMTFLIINGINHPHDGSRGWKAYFNDRDDDTDDIHTGDKNTGHYQEVYKPEIQKAVLNINGGVTNYVIKDTTANLFEADTRENNGGHYDMNTSIDSATQTIDFGMNGNNGEHRNHGFTFVFGNSRSNKAYVKLNTKPAWDINVEAGVAHINFDLSAYKVQNLSINGGVSSFKIRMGQPLAETDIDINTGVSRNTLEIPKNTACHITSDAGLSSKTLDGFQKVSDNEYETPGFDKATNKMFIKLSGGLSKFRVRQY